MQATFPTRRTESSDSPQAVALPQLIDINSIEPHPDNPRQDFPAEELLALSASLTDLTMLAPLQVEPAGLNRFRLLSGERRWRAAKLANWEKIPAYIRRLAPHQAVKILAEDNLQHRELNPIERARALALLVKPMHDGGAGMTHAQLGERFGMDRSSIANLLRLLKLPPAWQEEVRAGVLNGRQARALVPYIDRPDVLAAVAADRAANPADWRTAEQFEEQLAAVAGRLDSLAKVAAPAAAVVARRGAPEVNEIGLGPDTAAAVAAGDPEEDEDEGDEEATPAGGISLRRLPPPRITWLLECVERMSATDELLQLLQAAKKRLKALAKPSRRA